jgi:hypothetical protein
MKHGKIGRLFFVGLIVSLFVIESALAAENVRVAYPSMNASVFCVLIAEKEGYLRERAPDVQLLSIRGEIAIRMPRRRNRLLYQRRQRPWRRPSGCSR